MSDLALMRREDGNFDLAFDENSGDLSTSDSLENAVIISIGTYARERNLGKSANLKPTVGGWWGDALDEKGVLGGYLYEAFPGKLNDATAKSVEGLVVDALKWMIDDGVAKSVTATAVVADAETVKLEVSVERPGGGEEEAFTYEVKWKASDGI